ncbi:MAG: hypothetical protein MUC38_10595 [Cyclobacteriaceae bacterium]|jgi:hypothetical protein|nr:hypothetical protein [Cyclobacteriaceae bacterium]
MGRVNSQVLFSFQAKTCACDRYAAESKPSCCRDEVELIQLDEDQQPSSVFHTADLTPLLVAVVAVGYDLAPLHSVAQRIPFRVADPPPAGPPIYQKNCSLIFYEAVA